MTLATRLSSATALAALALVAGAASASAGVNPALNNPDYYEQGGAYECSKVEYADGLKSFTMAAGVKYYVKAGTVVTPGMATYYDDTFDSVKDISFIITCVPTGGGYPPS